MAKDRTYKEPKKLRGKENEKAILQIIYECACRGLSKSSIAVKLGLTHEEFIELLMSTDKRPTMSYEQGRAVFEEENLAKIESLLDNPDTLPALVYKAARENLKTREEWAPATRAVRVEVQDKASVFTFEALSEEEQDQIKSAHQGTSSDDEEDKASQD